MVAKKAKTKKKQMELLLIFGMTNYIIKKVQL